MSNVFRSKKCEVLFPEVPQPKSIGWKREDGNLTEMIYIEVWITMEEYRKRRREEKDRNRDFYQRNPEQLSRKIRARNSSPRLLRVDTFFAHV